MSSVVGFTGFAQVGKDSAAGFLAEFGYKRLAFADILRQSLYNLDPVAYYESPTQGNVGRGLVRVRELVDEFGWDVVKVWYPEVRELLQRMGTEVGRALYGESFWVDRVMGQIEPDGKYVITDVRFSNEADAVRKAGGRLFRIDRPGVGSVNGHISDTGIESLSISGRISNHGDLAEYRANVLRAVGIRID